MAGFELLERLGEGGRSTVYRGSDGEREVAVKLYKARALARHENRLGGNLAEYEFGRNRALYEVPGLSTYIAEPIACVVTPECSAIVQELLDGELYYFYRRSHPVAGLRPHLERILELAHAAGHYDLDMHSLNLMVVEKDGEALPKLFDFNLIPFHVRPPNFVVAALLATGLMSPRSRDRRLLRTLDRAGKRHRKLLRYF